MAAKDRRATKSSFHPKCLNSKLLGVKSYLFHERGQARCHPVRVKPPLTQNQQKDRDAPRRVSFRRVVVELDVHDADGFVPLSADTLVHISFVFTSTEYSVLLLL